MSKYGVFSGPYFPVFGLNTDIYSVNLCSQSKNGKIRTRKNSVFGHFLCSECLYSQVQLKEWQVQQLFHRKVKISAVKIPEYVLGPLRKLHFIA